MTSLVLIISCLCLGVLLRKRLPEGSHVTINTIILHVPLPATALLHVPHLEWKLNLISVVLTTWIIFGFSYFFFSQLGRKLGWHDEIIGCLILTAGLCNSAFVGFPVIEALYGKEGLKYAVLLDQPGSFLIVSTWAIIVATKFSGQNVPGNELFKKILFFPPFIGFMAALILGLLGWHAEGMIQTLLERLAIILTPLAMISVGLQLKVSEIKNDLKYLVAGIGFKLALAPLVIYFIYQFIGLEKEVFEIVVMESAMATMITAGIVAQAHNLRPKLAGLMVGVSVPLSFVTLSLWYTFLH